MNMMNPYIDDDGEVRCSRCDATATAGCKCLPKTFRDVARGPYSDHDRTSAVNDYCDVFSVDPRDAEEALCGLYLEQLRSGANPAQRFGGYSTMAVSLHPHAAWARLLAYEHQERHFVCGRCGGHDVERDVYRNRRGLISDDEGPRCKLACSNPDCHQGFADDGEDFYEIFA
jgi:hypothetical protein